MRNTDVSKLTDEVSINENVGGLKISMNNWFWFVLVQKYQS
jgi:hypothetical protein